MQLTQEKFDQIVNALVDQLDAKHAHAQIVVGSGPAQPFHIGYSVASDALHAVLTAQGVQIADDDEYTACPCCDGVNSPYVSGAPCDECNGTGRALLEPGTGARRLQSVALIDAAQEAAGDNLP